MITFAVHQTIAQIPQTFGLDHCGLYNLASCVGFFFKELQHSIHAAAYPYPVLNLVVCVFFCTETTLGPGRAAGQSLL